MINKYKDIRDIFARQTQPYVTLCKFHPKKKRLVVSETTKIVIEGFPRSANTWSVVAFEELQSDIKNHEIAHHLHAPAQVIYAVKNNIPCILLIREPNDAAKSLSLRESTTNLENIYKRYCSFYQPLQHLKEKVLVCEFKEATENFPKVIQRLNKMHNINISCKNMSKETKHKIFKRIEEINRTDDRAGKKGLAMPSKDKQLKLRNINTNEGKWRTNAEKIYKHFTLPH